MDNKLELIKDLRLEVEDLTISIDKVKTNHDKCSQKI